VCLVLTGAEIEGSTIPKAVPVEGVVPEAEVVTRAATEPRGDSSPRDDRRGAWRCAARDELGRSRPLTRNLGRGADSFDVDVRGRDNLS
jgi:hypothetical protein